MMRDVYLTRLEEYKADGRQIVYMDESWINKNITPNNVWHDNTLSTINYTPSGKGARFIMIGAGSKDGWLPNSFRIWQGNNEHEDYHTEMNSEVMNDWLLNYCFPNMDARGVLVLDRAPYHTSVTDATKTPQSGWKKEELVRYILDHDEQNQYTENMLLNEEHVVEIEGEDGNRRRYTRKGMLKPVLLDIARRLAPPKIMKVAETVTRYNEENNKDIRILFLPDAHPTLNPIEMVWSWVKVEVAKRNTSHRMRSLKDLTLERVNEITPEMWYKSCMRSDRCGREYMEQDDEVMHSGDEEDEEDENNEDGTENNEGYSDSDSSDNSVN